MEAFLKEISNIPEGMEPMSNPMDLCRLVIASQLLRSLPIRLEVAIPTIEIAKKGPHDFHVAIPRLRLPGKPDEIAKRVADEFQADALIEKVTSSGIFVNYFLRKDPFIRSVLHTIRAHKGIRSYGNSHSGAGKTVVVEFSSPNIAKPFHAGHLRSTIIGAFLANLFDATGWKVIKLNYLGDWGTQYGLLALGFERYGSEEELKTNPILHLFQVYVAIGNDVRTEEAEGRDDTRNKAKSYFASMEEGHPEALALWQTFRDLSIEEYIKTYERLNVQFDIFGGESLVTAESMNQVMQNLEEEGLLTRKTVEEGWKKTKNVSANEGSAEPCQDEANPLVPEEPENGLRGKPLALAVDLNAFKLGKPALQKPDGSRLYILRDIAGAFERHKAFNFDKMIYVAGDQQDFHFAQCFKILELLKAPFVNQLEHINFGRVHGMSTRTGEVVFLKDILDAAKEAMLEQAQTSLERFAQIENPDSMSDQVGITAVKIQDLQAKRGMAYSFDWKRMTSFEGDTGPYLQYAHVRLCSMERKVAPKIILRSSVNEIDTSLLREPKAREIVLQLATYPDVVLMALKTYEPSTVVTYCFKLAHLISSAWETLVVKGQEMELAQARLLLFICARDVLHHAMLLLSLKPLERM